MWRAACHDDPKFAGHRPHIGPQCTLIGGGNHHTRCRDLPIWRQGVEPGHHATLENDVWLGAGVAVLGGVRIGRGSVVAAGAVVTQDIPPCVIAGEVPARPLIRQAPPAAGSAGRLEERWFRAAVVTATAAGPARAAMRPAGRRRPGVRDGLQEDAPWAATLSADE